MIAIAFIKGVARERGQDVLNIHFSFLSNNGYDSNQEIVSIPFVVEDMDKTELELNAIKRGAVKAKIDSILSSDTEVKFP